MASDAHAGKLDIVLPIRSDVNWKEGDIDRVAKGLFPSLRAFGYLEVTGTVHLICPESDEAEIRERIVSRFKRFRFVIHTDEETCREAGFDVPGFARVRPWIRQQLLKIAVGSKADAPVVLVLDSDVMAMRPLALASIPTSALPFTRAEIERDREWFEASALALGLELEALLPDLADGVMGVTPEFLYRDLLSGLVDTLRARSGDGAWGPYLLQYCKDSRNTVTEYTLYWLWYTSRRLQGCKHIPLVMTRFVGNPSKFDPASFDPERRMFMVVQSRTFEAEDYAQAYRRIAAATPTQRHPVPAHDSQPRRDNPSADARPIEILLVLFANAREQIESLLQALARSCSTAFCERLTIVAHKSVLDRAREIAATLNWRVRVFEVDEFFYDAWIPQHVRKDADVRGIIELAFSRICRTDFYLVLNHRTFPDAPLDQRICVEGRLPRETAASSAGQDAAALTAPLFLNTHVARALVDEAIADESGVRSRPTKAGSAAARFWRRRYWKEVESRSLLDKLYYDGLLCKMSDVPDASRNSNAQALFELMRD